MSNKITKCKLQKKSKFLQAFTKDKEVKLNTFIHNWGNSLTQGLTHDKMLLNECHCYINPLHLNLIWIIMCTQISMPLNEKTNLLV